MGMIIPAPAAPAVQIHKTSVLVVGCTAHGFQAHVCLFSVNLYSIYNLTFPFVRETSIFSGQNESPPFSLS